MVDGVGAVCDADSDGEEMTRSGPAPTLAPAPRRAEAEVRNRFAFLPPPSPRPPSCPISHHNIMKKYYLMFASFNKLQLHLGFKTANNHKMHIIPEYSSDQTRLAS